MKSIISIVGCLSRRLGDVCKSARAGSLCAAFVWLLLSGAALLQATETRGEKEKALPVNVIVDTDMFSDCDDAGALAVLHKLADFGEVNILGMVINSNNNDKAVGAVVSAINTYYGRPNIPMGSYHGEDCKRSRSDFTTQIRDEFPHSAPPDDQLPPAFKVYRKLLAESRDGDTVIISLGFLFNLRDLLNSQPDEISPLSGMDLIQKKVKKLVVMGGAFPESDPQNSEFNFAWTQPKCAQEVIARWPTEIIFSGFEVGDVIITGKPLVFTPPSNPVRRAYELFRGNRLVLGRASYDLTAVLAAVRDPDLYWALSEPGICILSDKGESSWRKDPEGKHRYLIEKVPAEVMADAINFLLILPPARSGT